MSMSPTVNWISLQHSSSNQHNGTCTLYIYKVLRELIVEFTKLNVKNNFGKEVTLQSAGVALKNMSRSP